MYDSDNIISYYIIQLNCVKSTRNLKETYIRKCIYNSVHISTLFYFKK